MGSRFNREGGTVADVVPAYADRFCSSADRPGRNRFVADRLPPRCLDKLPCGEQSFRGFPVSGRAFKTLRLLPVFMVNRDAKNHRAQAALCSGKGVSQNALKVASMRIWPTSVNYGHCSNCGQERRRPQGFGRPWGRLCFHHAAGTQVKTVHGVSYYSRRGRGNRASKRYCTRQPTHDNSTPGK